MTDQFANESGQSESAGSVAPQYLHLTARAADFVRDAGGSVSEDALIAFVFGSRGAADTWRQLLRQMLGTSDALECRPDGFWAIPGFRAPSLASDLDFVALDVETTGLRPVSQRIIEIALVRYTSGRETDRFVTHLNPGRRIPRYISTLTGIVDLDVEDAPRFAEVAERVETFIGDSILLGHNVDFDIRFVNAELSRAERPQLINERIDTMGLAMRLLPSLKRPSLDRVASELGLPPRKIHRAAVDAEMSARAGLLLMEKASAMGIDSLARMKSASTPLRPRPKDDIGRGKALLDRSILSGIPKEPGVYLMRDQFDRIIYVGKAKNLRDRVASYFSQPLGYTRKMDGLLESIDRIEFELTGSELQALLLEAQLIRRYQPRYNTVMRTSEQYPYIKVDQSSAWPKVTLARVRKDDGSRTFGPFKSARATKIAVELINDHFPLRTCTRSFKNAKSYGSPCIRLDLKQCLGPCVGRADRDAYMALVRQVIAFLQGDDEVILERIWSELEIAAEKLDYERARRLRNQLSSLRSVVLAQRSLRSADEQRPLLLAQAAPPPNRMHIMVIVQGRVWSSHAVATPTIDTDLAGRLARSWERFRATPVPPVDQHSVDETHIISRWLRRHEESPVIIGIPENDLDWISLANRLLALGPVDLAWVPPAVTEGEDIVLEPVEAHSQPYSTLESVVGPDPTQFRDATSPASA